MKYPSMVKQNMRYRGPVESRKMNRFYLETHQNLHDIFKQLEEIDKKISSFKEEIEEFVSYEQKLKVVKQEIKSLGGKL